MDKLRIITIILTQDNNPLKWTNDDLMTITKHAVVVGYILKNKSKTSNEPNPVLNLYVISGANLSDPTKIIDLHSLQSIFLQWIESLAEDPKSYMFRNPPLEEWLNTKENWVKKTTYKLSQSYNRPYDECMSTLYMVILKAYNKATVYLGNLHYIVVAVNNELKLEHRFMLNRLHGGHPEAIHLDAVPSDFNAGLQDSISSLHEIIGGPTFADFEEDRNHAIWEEILDDLKKEFSPREIDQIVNTPGFLPNTLYRKLIKWRKTHKREDYL